MVYAKRSGQKHLLHLLIQPHMTSYSIKAQSSIFNLSNVFRGTVSKCLSGSKDSVIPKKVFEPINFGAKNGVPLYQKRNPGTVSEDEYRQITEKALWKWGLFGKTKRVFEMLPDT